MNNYNLVLWIIYYNYNYNKSNNYKSSLLLVICLILIEHVVEVENTNCKFKYFKIVVNIHFTTNIICFGLRILYKYINCQGLTLLTKITQLS